jgi:dipeptidyl aminopeptidase/acylaminoacyl peptidase
VQKNKQGGFMSFHGVKLFALWCVATPIAAQGDKPFDAAAAFGARPSVANLSLSPDGQRVAYVVPIAGQGSVVYTLELTKGAAPRAAMGADGKPDRLGHCEWVSNARLACVVYGVVLSNRGMLEPVPFTRIVAVNADGSNRKLLSTKTDFYTRGSQMGGGDIIDWLPDENDAVLMARVYLPNDHVGSRLGTLDKGVGVDWIDTQNVQTKQIEPPRLDAVEYISDGRGAIRIMGLRSKSNGGRQDTGIVNYLYREQGSREWQKLADYNWVDRTGFRPWAIDRDRNVAYGLRKQDGRLALFAVALDGSLREELIYARPDVDVAGIIRIGRRKRVVGVSYVTDTRNRVYFDSEIQGVAAALSKALPGLPRVSIAGASVDESKLMVIVSSDQDPGVYYLFDRKAKQLQTFLVVRSQLEGVKLASMKPVSYPARDGTLIPGYLTMPPGQENAKGLPAILLPHGGPDARDEWGFNWLSQYYASRGYAVLQPNFRGSAGYGDAWFQENGFKSWPTAIGDVVDGAHWLIAQGIADPAKLGIVGWSYGGYAALQSAVVDPTLFKAVVAIAPVTDLDALKEQHRRWSDFNLVSNQVGDGPHVREGSPAMNADKIKVPVLLFHGTLDRNVDILQSQEMASRLIKAGGRCELVTYNDLDEYLDDSSARTEMLRKSDAFLRQAMGM